MRNSVVPILIGAAGLGAVSLALAAAGSGGDSAAKPVATSSGKYTPEQAANALLLYLQLAEKQRAKLGLQGNDFGSKDAPNLIIASAQADMLQIAADGIYGPATKARGEALTGKPWPSPVAAKPAAKPSAAKPAAASKASATIPSNKIAVTPGQQAADAAVKAYAKEHAIKVPPPSESAEQMVHALSGEGQWKTSKAAAAPVMTAASPRPIAPPGGAVVTPTERAPKAAAQALYTYVTGLVRQGRGSELGTKATPNNTVAAAQRDMRGVSSDGIYGPKTQARGKVLLGLEFPSRYGTGAKVAATPPAPPAPPLTTANDQERRERAAEGLLSYLQKPNADQGAKGKPSATVKAAQATMGGVVADGVYGPATRARASQLINKPFPPRK